MRHPVFVLLLLSMNSFLCFSGQSKLPRYLMLVVRNSGVIVQAVNRLPVYTMPSGLLVHESRGVPACYHREVKMYLLKQNIKEAKAVSHEDQRFIDPSKFLRIVE